MASMFILGCRPVCPASLLSFQAWPTSSYSCSADPVWVRTACSGHCRSTHLLPHIDSTGGQRGSLSSSYHKHRSDESFTLTRSKQVFYADWTLLDDSLKQMLLIDKGTVKCKPLSHRFLQNVLWPLHAPGWQSGRPKFKCTSSDMLVPTCCTC